MVIAIETGVMQRCADDDVGASSTGARNTSSMIASLQDKAVSALGEKCEDVLQQLGSDVSLLPLSARVQLLAIARRRKCLDDTTLSSLVDKGITTLDVSESRVGDAAVCGAAQSGSLHCVTTADLRRSACTHGCAEALARGAPKLRLLRVQGDVAAGMLEELVRPLSEHSAVHWEELNDSEQYLRMLPRLRFLVWPRIPESALIRLRASRPGIIVLGKRGQVLLPRDAAAVPITSSRHLPAEVDLRVSCDAYLIAGMSPEAVRPQPGKTEALDRSMNRKPLPQRFKAAVESTRSVSYLKRNQPSLKRMKHCDARRSSIDLHALIRTKALHPTVKKTYAIE